MAQEMKLPELGENIESAEVVSILVSEGDTVSADQPVMELETDKATAEVPAAFAGTVRKIHVQKGDQVKVGQTLLTLEEEKEEEEEKGDSVQDAGADDEDEGGDSDDAPAEDESGESPDRDGSEGQEPAATVAADDDADDDAGDEPEAVDSDMVEETPQPAPPPRPAAGGSPAPASPAVRRLARELGLDVSQVAGSGSGGRISEEDVKARARALIAGRGEPAPAAGPAGTAQPDLPDFTRFGEVERQPLSNIRRRIAENMSRAWSVVPQVTQADRADITGLEEFRRRYGDRVAALGGKLTVTAIAVKLAAAALRRFPRFNASLDAGRGELIVKHYVHIGVAVDTDRGLLVPVIRDADRKGLAEIAAELSELAEKTRQRKAGMDDLQGASFTITNLGGLGTTTFTPIVNWPEVAILGLGRARREPTEVDGEFEARSILPLSLSYDHRAVDGADAARFLRWLAEALENPLLAMLEG